MKGIRKWNQTNPNVRKITEGISEETKNARLSAVLAENEALFSHTFRNCSDIVFRKIGRGGEERWLVVYLSTLIEERTIDDHVLSPLVSDRSVTAGSTTVTSDVPEIVKAVLNGRAVILTSGEAVAMTVGAAVGNAQRSLEEPSSEPVIRGPRDGFIENIKTNIALIRKRLRTPRLKMESLTLGELSGTEVVIAYIDGIASVSVLEEVRERVGSIRIDGILDSGYVEEFINDNPYSPFPQSHNTERPDVVAAELLEGKVAILVDNSPFALIVPMTFWTGLQASEDYYLSWQISSFVRWIRFLFFFIAVFAPSLYVAVTTYHQEMIPTNLVLSIASSREAVPFPALIEALLMETIFEALREAGIRLPKQIGQAISIVGALVIGQAAVQAGIISAPVVIIVSITGIATFTIPRYSFASGVRLLRFPILFLAGSLGLYGVVLGFLGILLHVTALRSFGVPYFTPVGPLSFAKLKDVLVRAPIWAKGKGRRSSV